jgi:hypothetical protein
MSESYEQVTYAGKTEFLPYSVLDAAYARMELLVRTYDEIIVTYSGGKDSGLTLELLRRTYDKLGMNDRKVRFSFVDMEFIEDEVIKTVESYFADERFDGTWICAPQVEPMVVLGERRNVILWDKTREEAWGRLPPEHAMMTVPGLGDNEPFIRNHERRAIVACMQPKGSCVLINSHRFTENEMIRMVLMKGKPDTCWLFKNTEGMTGVDLARPIYDWSVKDVFKFFYDEGVPYTLAYDINMHSGNALRAGTPPLDLVTSGKLEGLRKSYPTLFSQITTMWPEMLTHERYALDIDIEGTVAKYAPGWGGMADYVRENIRDPDARAAAISAIHKARTCREGQRIRGKGKAPCYNMPLLWVWTVLVRGDYRRGIPKKHNPTKAMIDFEAAALASPAGARA